ncbi:hypothetical protein CAPTEDRAFT_216790 [Capitella teleta]|uniref:Aminopeptidase n=1 Tax=Capitella teleta TaxID=283909 RepID=R7V0D9_CAPTE|nr:hypothetical protein CAPTEDRAFT_216790 [Capitella teleta]|eukprot:ELU11982.1 hypothetical protein CAPTEDRAFT_216790 [Capitella teleta]
MNSLWILLMLHILVNVKSWTLEESLDRLPGSLRPLEYNITLQPFIYNSDAYSTRSKDSMNGHVKIKFLCVEDTTRIVLHSVDLHILKVFLTGLKSNIEIQEVLFDEKRDFLCIIVDSGLVHGHTYSVDIEYSAKIATKRGLGLFLHHYPQGNSTADLLWTQFSPNGARRAFPCFDEPEYKALFDVVIIRRHHMTSLSNAHLLYTENVTERVSVKNDRSTWMADHFARTPKMSTYLVCFVICEYSHIEATTSSGTLVRVWTRPEVIHLAGPSLSVAVSTQEWFEEYTGLIDPMYKMDHFARNAQKYIFGGAMENWGLITYDEKFLVSHEKWSDSQHKMQSFTIIAHEVAHQWFGNLVTCHWWNDNWLNEGFASKFENVPLEGIIVSDYSELEFLTHLIPVQAYDYPDAFMSSVSWNFESFSENEKKDIFALEQYLKRYLRKFAYSTATSDDLWDCLTEQAAIEDISDSDGSPLIMKQKFDPWLYQSGYPIIHVSWDPIIKTINLTQSHFNPDLFQGYPASEFKYGIISAVNTLKAIQYLEKERNGLPWKLASDGLQQWITWIQRHTDTWPLFQVEVFADFNVVLQEYLRKFVDPVYGGVGWDKPQDNYFDSLLRLKIIELACQLGNEDCLRTANLQFQRWKIYPDSSSFVEDELRFFGHSFFKGFASNEDYAEVFTHPPFACVIFEIYAADEIRTLSKAFSTSKRVHLCRENLGD